MNRAFEATFDQRRYAAAVVDVGVGEEQSVRSDSPSREMSVSMVGVTPSTLIQTAVHQKSLLPHLEQMH